MNRGFACCLPSQDAPGGAFAHAAPEQWHPPEKCSLISGSVHAGSMLPTHTLVLAGSVLHGAQKGAKGWECEKMGSDRCPSGPCRWPSASAGRTSASLRLARDNCTAGCLCAHMSMAVGSVSADISSCLCCAQPQRMRRLPTICVADASASVSAKQQCCPRACIAAATCSSSRTAAPAVLHISPGQALARGPPGHAWCRSRAARRPACAARRSRSPWSAR